MIKLNLKRLQKLCEEIHELESKVFIELQEELQPVLQELTSILRDNIPQVLSITWTMSVDSEPTMELSKQLDNEQVGFMVDLLSIILNLRPASRLAFGEGTEITLDVTTGKLIKE